MALRLISTLTVLILACFAYKTWDKTKVPADIPAQDAWKVKTIDFLAKICHKLAALLTYLGVDPHQGRPIVNALFNSLHVGPWPTSLLYKDPADFKVKVYKQEIEGVPVIIFESLFTRHDDQRGVFIYFHGGAFEWFDAEYPTPTALAIAREAGLLVVSVDYRLAPEHQFPAAYDDCLKVTKYIIKHHHQFGVSPSKVVVAGDSAGGNLAAGIAQNLKEQVQLQILLYPLLQAFDFQTSSYRENAKTLKHILDADFVVKSLLNYAGFSPSFHEAFLENKHFSHELRTSMYKSMNLTHQSGFVNNLQDISNSAAKTLLDPRFMPMMATSVDEVADAYIVTVKYDVLRDDGLMYAARLEATHKVNVTLHNYRDGFHGFFHFSTGPFKLQVAERALKDLILFLRRRFPEESSLNSL